MGLHLIPLVIGAGIGAGVTYVATRKRSQRMSEKETQALDNQAKKVNHEEKEAAVSEH